MLYNTINTWWVQISNFNHENTLASQLRAPGMLPRRWKIWSHEVVTSRSGCLETIKILIWGVLLVIYTWV